MRREIRRSGGLANKEKEIYRTVMQMELLAKWRVWQC